MKIFLYDYDAADVVEISKEKYEDMLNEDIEKTLVDIHASMEYFILNRDEKMLTFLKSINTDATLVMHFDSESDVYIVM